VYQSTVYTEALARLGHSAGGYAPRPWLGEEHREQVAALLGVTAPYPTQTTDGDHRRDSEPASATRCDGNREMHRS
jgi:hypothetical protein